MNNIYKRFSNTEIREIAKVLHKHFTLADEKRIYELILQVDSIDTALHLLICHRESIYTLDHIVYEHLHYKDNL